MPAGSPWERPFLNHWRLLLVRNDRSGTGLRTVFVDGWPVSSGPASVAAVPATGATLTLGGPGPLHIAECFVWDGATLSDADVVALSVASRGKWEVPVQTTLPLAPAFVLRAGAEALPVGLPAPALWLDAASVGDLFADTAGSKAAAANGYVLRWRDRSRHGRDYVWSAASSTGPLWSTAPVDGINGLPVVRCPATGGGTFQGTAAVAVSGGGAFTVVAVFRPGAVGGHALRVNGKGAYAATGWVEAFGVDVPRLMHDPTWTVGDAPTMFCWEGGSSDMERALRINTLWQGGRYWTSTTAGPNTAWTTRPLQLGPGVALGELLCFDGTLTSEQRTALAGYLQLRWGVALPATGGVAGALPAALVDDVFDTTVLASDLRGTGGTAVTTVGARVATWFSRRGDRSWTANPARPSSRASDGTPMDSGTWRTTRTPHSRCRARTGCRC